MHRIPGRAALFAATAAVSIAVGLAGPSALAGPAIASAGHWRIVLRGQGVGSLVIAPARTSIWAFGVQATSQSARSFAVVRHWDGHRWSGTRRVAAASNSYVVCAGSSSASNVWAFEQTGGGPGRPPSYAAALKLRNGRWVTEKVLASHRLGAFMSGCNVLGPADVWVFGGQVAGRGRAVGTWHLTRSGWRHFSTGNLAILFASVVSPADIWGAAADLSTATPRPVLARWNGKNWTEDRAIGAALPKPASKMSVGIQAVNALSANDIWVQAITYNQIQVTGTVVVHWNGSVWHRVRQGSFGYYLPTAVTDGHSGWWAIPYPAAGSSQYLLHGARGRWTKFPMPDHVLANGELYLHLSHVPHSAAMVADATLVGTHGHFTPVVLSSGALPR